MTYDTFDEPATTRIVFVDGSEKTLPRWQAEALASQGLGKIDESVTFIAPEAEPTEPVPELPVSPEDLEALRRQLLGTDE